MPGIGEGQPACAVAGPADVITMQVGEQDEADIRRRQALRVQARHQPAAFIGRDAGHVEVDVSQPQVDEGCAGAVADKERADARDQPAVRVEEMPVRRPVLRGGGRERAPLGPREPLRPGDR